jgi:hypothetical protein
MKMDGKILNEKFIRHTWPHVLGTKRMNKIEFVKQYVLNDASVISVFDLDSSILKERVQKRIDQASKVYDMINEHFEPRNED